MSGSDVLADIAARYGAALAPGVTVQRIAPGVSSVALPVWDGKQLIVPGWKEQREAERRASIKRGKVARAKALRSDAETRTQLQQLHAGGAQVSAMVAALGIGAVAVRGLLADLGLVVERALPGPSPDTQRRADEVRRLAAEGLSRDAIAAAVGFADVKYLLGFMRRSMPGFALPDARRGAGQKLLPGQSGQSARGGVDRVRQPSLSRAAVFANKRADRDALVRRLIAEGASLQRLGVALGIESERHLRRVIAAAVPDHGFNRLPKVNGLPERDVAVAKLLPDHSYAEIMARMGLTHGQVLAASKRARRDGLLSSAPLARRRGSGRQAGAKVHVARNAEILALCRGGMGAADIAAKMDLSRNTVNRVIWRAGESVRPAGGSAAQRRTAELPDLVARRLSARQIAAHWGVSLACVYGTAHRAGVSLNSVRPAPRNKGEIAAQTVARRELVAVMFRRGFTHAEIKKTLRISGSTLCNDIAALGIAGTSAYAQRRKAGAGAAEPERRAA